jgi:integrase/recombinase XerD
MDNPEYRLSTALLRDGVTERLVIVDSKYRLHHSGTKWLQFLSDAKRSPNTIKSYGSRLAYYLSWTLPTADWRSVNVSHLGMWRRTLANSAFDVRNGVARFRSNATIALWMTPVRSFYEWADAEGLITSDLFSRMTQLKYFAAGTGAGGEQGTWRRVLVDELKPSGEQPVSDPEWIEDPLARAALESLTLNTRDRFLIDLMYYTGIRAGEALSLFAADMHFGGGSAALGCKHADPHFHVKTNNPVENKARAKGAARLLYVSHHIIDRYVDYMMEREYRLRNNDFSPHVFVNLYSTSEHNGKAMKYGKLQALVEKCGRRIGCELTGPHMLRHTFATRLVRGIDCEPQGIDVVQDLLGHRSIESTRVYTHDLEPAKKRALAAVAPRTVLLRGTE